MSKATYSKEEVVRRGEEIYERDIRAKVEAGHRGEFIVIDVDSGDYDIDVNALEATHRVAARHPDGDRCLLRIGSPAAYQILTPGVIEDIRASGVVEGP
jgi:hypothetical protein